MLGRDLYLMVQIDPAYDLEGEMRDVSEWEG